MASAYYWSSPPPSSTTADLRTYGAELKAGLIAAGCIQTADTGQADWTTVVQSAAASGTTICYEIWQLACGLRMKLIYATSSATALCPRMQVIFGTGSDGAGNLTGTVFTGPMNIQNNGPSGGNRPSYISNLYDHFTIIWKVGGATSGGSFTPSLIATSVTKMVDANGDVDAVTPAYDFMHMHQTGGSGSLVNALRTVYVPSTGYAPAANAWFAFIPLTITSSLVGTDQQVYTHFVATPRTRMCHGACSVFTAEIPANTTFNATLVGPADGSAARGYVSVGYAFGSPIAQTTATTYSTAILWEP